MKQEFEKRIGLVITDEEYDGIEKAYMGLPESVDKDKFVKIWLKEGGIQDLFDKRLVEVKKRDDEIGRIKAQADDYLCGMNQNASQVINLRKEVKKLESVLDEISGTLSKRSA